MDNIVDAHYFMLPTQGNVYSSSILNLTSGFNKLIVASLKKKIFSFEYSGNTEGLLKPTVKEIPCTYIPSGAEIISVDAFNKAEQRDDFQIGIAIAKLNTEGSPETYLNIYSEQDLDLNYTLNIDSIAQNCLMVELAFIPYHLTHTFLFDQQNSSDSKEVVWLLSGSDCKIHVFQEDPLNHSYNEGDVAQLFSELSNPPSIVMWLDTLYTHQFTRRVSVIGCECGTMQLSLVNTKTNTVVSSHTDIFDGPVSQVLLFSLHPEQILPPKGIQVNDNVQETSSGNASTDLHLLVCNSLEPSVVYMNVEDGLTEKYILEGSDGYDVCLCACVADLDMDGRNELLLGTFGQKILMYKWSGRGWRLVSHRSTASPVHALHYVDLIGDGVNELVVQMLSGVQVMQHDPEQVQKIFLSRLRRLCLSKEVPESRNATIKKTPPEKEGCSCDENSQHYENTSNI